MSVYTLIALFVAAAALFTVMASVSRRHKQRPAHVRARQVDERIAQARSVEALARGAR